MICPSSLYVNALLQHVVTIKPPGRGWTWAFCLWLCLAEWCLDSWRHNTAKSSWRPLFFLLRSHQRWGWSDCWTLSAWCGTHYPPRHNCWVAEQLQYFSSKLWTALGVISVERTQEWAHFLMGAFSRITHHVTKFKSSHADLLNTAINDLHSHQVSIPYSTFKMWWNVSFTSWTCCRQFCRNWVMLLILFWICKYN